MQKQIENHEVPLVRRRPRPLSESDLDNLPSTSKGAISISVSTSISGCNSWQLDATPLSSCLLLEEPGFSGRAKPKGSANKRLPSAKLDPDYNPKAKLGTAPSRMMTRGQLKRNREMLLEEPPAAKEPSDPKPKPRPKPQTASLRRFRTGQRLMPTVWHSGQVCHHALRQICNPGTMNASASDVERWRAIESICLDLRGIDVRGEVGVLKGPVSFEDVFEVLGLDEQGEAQVDPTPLPEVKVDFPGKATEVASSGEGFDIEKFLMPPLTPIQGALSRVPPKARGSPKEPSSRRVGMRATKSTYKRR